MPAFLGVPERFKRWGFRRDKFSSKDSCATTPSKQDVPKRGIEFRIQGLRRWARLGHPSDRNWSVSHSPSEWPLAWHVTFDESYDLFMAAKAQDLSLSKSWHCGLSCIVSPAALCIWNVPSCGWVCYGFFTACFMLLPLSRTCHITGIYRDNAGICSGVTLKVNVHGTKRFLQESTKFLRSLRVSAPP